MVAKSGEVGTRRLTYAGFLRLKGHVATCFDVCIRSPSRHVLSEHESSLCVMFWGGFMMLHTYSFSLIKKKKWSMYEYAIFFGVFFQFTHLTAGRMLSSTLLLNMYMCTGFTLCINTWILSS